MIKYNASLTVDISANDEEVKQQLNKQEDTLIAAPFKPTFRPKPAPRPQAGPRQQVREKADDELRINDEITVSQVRLVGENIPEQGIYPIAKAIALADELELDLVEISPKADPPVCKILDYQKYLYQQRRKAKEMKKNSTKVEIKEIRFGPNTDEHDFNFKLKHAQEFLQEGDKVKASVFFKGRSIVYSEQGEKLLLRFALELEEYGRAEQMPKLEGKRMIMMLSPVKKK